MQNDKQHKGNIVVELTSPKDLNVCCFRGDGEFLVGLPSNQLLAYAVLVHAEEKILSHYLLSWCVDGTPEVCVHFLYKSDDGELHEGTRPIEREIVDNNAVTLVGGQPLCELLPNVACRRFEALVSKACNEAYREYCRDNYIDPNE